MLSFILSNSNTTWWNRVSSYIYLLTVLLKNETFSNTSDIQFSFSLLAQGGMKLWSLSDLTVLQSADVTGWRASRWVFWMHNLHILGIACSSSTPRTECGVWRTSRPTWTHTAKTYGYGIWLPCTYIRYGKTNAVADWSTLDHNFANDTSSEHEYNKLHVTFRTWRSRTTNVKITVDTGLTSMSCVPTAQIDQPRYPGCRTCLDG